MHAGPKPLFIQLYSGVSDDNFQSSGRYLNTLTMSDPFPRSLLICGDATHFHVQEALRHFTMAKIHWLDQSSPEISVEKDILHRVVRCRSQDMDDFLASDVSFDIVVIDQPPSPTLVSKAAERLAPGGVLAMALSASWEAALKSVLPVFKHVHMFVPYDSSGTTS